MSNFQLTTGVIQRLMNGETVEKPVLQILGQKKIAGGSGADRYRLLMSDGNYSHSSVMLATQLNEKVEQGLLDTNAIVRLDKYICNVIQPDRRVIIVLEVEVLCSGTEVGLKLGNPVPFKPGQSAPAPATAAPPAPMPKPAPSTPKAANGGGNFYNRAVAGGQPKTPSTPGGTPMRIHPIASLTPYQNRWTIRARVTQKSNVRTWSNSRGEGKLFSMNFMDESGEIKATAFKDQVDQYYDMIEAGKIYYITKGQLKTANKQYSTVDNDYEMTFSSETQVTPCEDQTVNLPSVEFKFVPINQLADHEANELVDVIGVVRSFDDITKLMGKQSNREITKRDVNLVDESRVQLRVTLWGTDAEKFEGANNPIIAVKGAKLSSYGGRSLSILGSSNMMINPDIEQSHRLRGWYDSEGASIEYEVFRSEGGAGGSGGGSTNWKTFSQVKNENLGSGEKPDYFTSRGTVLFMKKDNCMYQACPTAECNKKVVDQGNGMFRCEKCSKEYPEFKWRMILQCNLADFTDNQWATCFQESAEVLLGKDANTLGSLRESNEAEFDQVFNEASFKSYIFKLRAKMESYNDESRLKTIVVEAKPTDFKEYNKKLISDIEQLLAGGK